ncbi:hypothetical protein Tco_1103995 [Tanacetum coccineum]
MFVDMDTELVNESSKKAEMVQESSSKRAGEELKSDNSKKQKLDENVEAEVNDEAEMKKHMERVSDDEVAIDAIPLATKPPIIVDWKIIKEGKIGYFQIIRADGSLRRNTWPEEAYERVLRGDLEVMFEPNVESEVWRNLQGYNVTVWKLFSSSGVYFVRFQNLHIIMLKYGLDQCDVVDIPMVERSKLDEDPNGTPVDPTRYRSMVGSLMYLTASRPDLVFVVCMCARYQAKPIKKHLTAVKYHAGCQDSRKSTSGSAQFVGEKLVSWSSKKQKCTAISTTEVEYVSLYGCCAQILWMRSQLTGYRFDYNKKTLYCDSKSAIALSCNTVQHSRTKHITVRYHFIKEQVANEIVELYFVKTAYQLADIFTKVLMRECFEFLIKRLGMQSITPEEMKHLAETDEE